MKKQIIRFVKPLVERFPQIARAYRQLRDNQEINEEPQITPLGFKLIGNADMQQGNFEVEETQLIERILPKVDVFVNIGANIGYYCCLAQKMQKHVIAFEPMARNLQFLLRNCRVNNWGDKMEVYPLALSDGVGVIEIYGSGTGASLVKGWAGTPESFVTLVPCSTLDTILGSRLPDKKCFILVDIEGAERRMLEGAASFLEKSPKPIWMVEICITEHQPKGTIVNPNLLSTFQMFWERGYKCFTANTECRLVIADEIKRIAETGIDTLKTHNFLFIDEVEMPEVFQLRNSSPVQRMGK